MRPKIKLLSMLATTVMLLLVLACTAVETPASAPTSAPESQASAPTLIHAENRQMAQQFAKTHQQIAQDWDEFRSDFDRWRNGLTSCDINSARTAFRGLAGDFDKITRQAGGLPRASVTRDLADQLIEAAGNEATALRRLRDRWQPEDTSLFEAVASQRTAGRAAQKEVIDQLMDLRETSDTGSVEEAQEFSTSFETLNEDWEKFHDNYNTLVDEQTDLSASDLSSQLEELLEELGDLVSAIEDLPANDTTEEMADSLKESAEAEESALKELQANFQAKAEDETADGEGESEATNGEPTDGNGDTPEDPFAAMSDLVKTSDDARDQVKKDLKNILEDSSAEKVADIDAFNEQYDLLVQEWDKFHQEYNRWQQTQGGCDRTAVAESLSDFSARFQELSDQLRDLPRGSFLRPIGALLSEAAEREEEALRVLRSTWRPFGADNYKALDRERTNADQLRRQADVAIQELLDKFGASAS